MVLLVALYLAYHVCVNPIRFDGALTRPCHYTNVCTDQVHPFDAAVALGRLCDPASAPRAESEKNLGPCISRRMVVVLARY